jgi:hypothetical protein
VKSDPNRQGFKGQIDKEKQGNKRTPMESKLISKARTPQSPRLRKRQRQHREKQKPHKEKKKKTPDLLPEPLIN